MIGQIGEKDLLGGVAAEVDVAKTDGRRIEIDVAGAGLQRSPARERDGDLGRVGVVAYDLQ